ncbi:MAG: hypothetical protein AB7I41_11310 [Candidatus Sericytochromatia bacterium]
MGFDFWGFFEAANAHLASLPGHVLALHFREVDSFECSRCAQCCTLPWSIGVTESYVKHWEPQFKQHSDPRFHDVFEPMQLGFPSGHFAFLKKQPDSYRCVLLDDDDLCLAQKHFGVQGKPEGCQYYPHIWQKVSGGLKVSHLMQSCRSAPAYLLAEPELVYRVIPEQEAESVHGGVFPITALPGLRFSREVLYLWLGLSLNTLFFEAELRSPIQNLRALNFALGQFLELTSRRTETLNLSIESLEQIYQRHSQHHARQARQIPLRTPFALEWFLRNLPPSTVDAQITDFFQAILKGERLWPRLKPAEHHLLNTFLRNYLARKLLSMHQWFSQRVNLFQQMLLLSAFTTLIQARVLACRELAGQEITLELLTTSVNLIEGRMIQSYSWIEGLEYHQLGPLACLQESERLLDLDLTLPPGERRLASQPLMRRF